MQKVLEFFFQFLKYDSFLLFIGMCLFLGFAELLRPAKKIPAKHFFFNFVYGLFSTLIVFAISPFIGAATAFFIQRFGLGLIDLRDLGFSSLGGDLFALLIANLIFDFFFYWYHRLEHKNEILWQSHLFHHCDEYLNVTSGARGSLLEVITLPLFVSFPMAILFKLPPVTIGILNLIPPLLLYVQHANMAFGFGPFWWLFVSPKFHRIHHSVEKKHFNKNFALFFPVWDIIFGTAWRPGQRELPNTGVRGVKIDTLSRAFLQPFQGFLSLVPRLRQKSLNSIIKVHRVKTVR
jgi:sterol desaturase/sphingolipid hydroxylase (fatty acid hydroxylase superfamily)